jgi:hypothetical protein
MASYWCSLAGNKETRHLGSSPRDNTHAGKGDCGRRRLVEKGECQAEQERKRCTAEMEQWHREEAVRRIETALQEIKNDLLEISLKVQKGNFTAF